jgi:hypothetical protein
MIMRSQVRFRVLSWGFFFEGEDSHGDHGLSSLVELGFKTPPGTSYSYITIHLIGKRNCASWASQPQKLVTNWPQPGGETTKSVRDMVALERKNIYVYAHVYINTGQYYENIPISVDYDVSIQ